MPWEKVKWGEEGSFLGFLFCSIVMRLFLCQYLSVLIIAAL